MVDQKDFKGVVILVDRGLMDGSAYVDEDDWQALMDDLGTNTTQLRDNRYDAVLHLVTAADGAEEFYAGINNEARYESVEQAKEKDQKLQQAYQGHSRLFIVDNSCIDFNAKIKRCMQLCSNVLGNNAGTTFYKKYLLVKNGGLNGGAFPIDLGKRNYEVVETSEIWLKT